MTNLFVGKKCIVRSNMAGVFFGEIANIEGSAVLMKDARKIYRWSGANTSKENLVSLLLYFNR